MTKSLCLILLFFMAGSVSAQESMRTIKADSIAVDIKVDDDYFAKGGWILEPGNNPDVFSIGSKWPYKTKKITFLTNRDSLTVDLPPGSTFDFIVLLNGSTPCHIRIATLANPIFMDGSVLIPALVGFLIALFAMLYLFKGKLGIRGLLYFGYAAPALFWGMTLVSGAIHGNYDHLRNVISELGAIGTRSERFTSYTLFVIALMSTLFSIGFYHASRRSRISAIPAILSFSMPLSMIWAAIFTMGNEFHGTAGPLPFLMVLGVALAFLLWRKRPELAGIRKLSALSFLLSMLIFLRFVEPFGREYEGLVQRFFYLGWTVWTCAVAHHIIRKDHPPRVAPPKGNP